MLQDASAPTDTGEVKENDAAKEAPLPKHTGKGMRAMQGFDSPDCLQTMPTTRQPTPSRTNRRKRLNR